MRSLLRTVLNRAPVPYVADSGSGGGAFGLFGGSRSDRTAHLQATGSVGTLYSIVNRTSVSTAAVDWHMHRLRQGGASTCEACDTPGVALVEDHLALRILNKPNDFYTRGELVESGQQHQDLTGETYLLVERDPRMRSIPLGLWLVRPDRMEPVPSPEKFLVGYIYRGPRGEKIPLDLDEVIQIRTPDPDDPYRGLGPVQSIMRDLDSAKYSAEWNRNFFLNSAEPGGIIEVPKELSDPQFAQLRMRWNEQHKGISRAHRVAILEHGKWIDRKYTMREMQFTELRHLSRDVIMEAFGMSKFAMGIVDDINRATADASSAWFSEQMTVPRLRRWKSALNNDFLPLFGATGQGVEFAYSNPVPPNAEQQNADLKTKTDAWAVLVNAGCDPDDAAQVVGLPPMRVRERERIEVAV